MFVKILLHILLWLESELCTDWDIERHNEERYIPVNIIDDENKQIVWMLMMYIEQRKRLFSN